MHTPQQPTDEMMQTVRINDTKIGEIIARAQFKDDKLRFVLFTNRPRMWATNSGRRGAQPDYKLIMRPSFTYLPTEKNKELDQQQGAKCER